MIFHICSYLSKSKFDEKSMQNENSMWSQISKGSLGTLMPTKLQSGNLVESSVDLFAGVVEFVFFRSFSFFAGEVEFLVDFFADVFIRQV